jgi:hypothetical protein
MILLNNSIVCIIVFGVLLQLLVEVKPQTIISKPGLRLGHTATLINDKLYILGGRTPHIRYALPKDRWPKESFLYPDFSVPFDTNDLKWLDISSYNINPQSSYDVAIKSGANNNTLFLISGDDMVYAKQIVENSKHNWYISYWNRLCNRCN